MCTLPIFPILPDAIQRCQHELHPDRGSGRRAADAERKPRYLYAQQRCPDQPANTLALLWPSADRNASLPLPGTISDADTLSHRYVKAPPARGQRFPIGRSLTNRNNAALLSACSVLADYVHDQANQRVKVEVATLPDTLPPGFPYPGAGVHRRSRRSSGGIYDECCKKSCSYVELRAYCDWSGKPDWDEDEMRLGGGKAVKAPKRRMLRIRRREIERARENQGKEICNR